MHEGPTFWDRPFIARVSGSYRLPWGFSAAGSFRAHSGWPNYRSVIFTQTLDGEPLPQGSTEVIVEPPGAARSPAVPLLDLRLDHRLELPGDAEFSTYLDVFNALNLNSVVGEGSRDDSFGAVVGILPPRVARVGVRLRFGLWGGIRPGLGRIGGFRRPVRRGLAARRCRPGGGGAFQAGGL